MFGKHDVHDGKAIISTCDFAPSAEQQEVIDAFLAMQQAMVSADHDALRALVEDGTPFVHMSGAVQSKEEFISEVGGPLTYFHSDSHIKRVDLDGDWAVVTARTALTARAYGAEGTFPINTNQDFHKVDGRWLRSHRA